MAEEIYSIYTPTEWADIIIISSSEAILKLKILPENTSKIPPKEKYHPLLKKAQKELLEYLKGERKNFTLPLSPQGTPFEQKVWNQLLNIPYGTTTTYGNIAKKIGKPKSARAVGNACRKNPIPIFIPCHRVIPAHGGLGGFSSGTHIKEKLLHLEYLSSCKGNLF